MAKETANDLLNRHWGRVIGSISVLHGADAINEPSYLAILDILGIDEDLNRIIDRLGTCSSQTSGAGGESSGGSPHFGDDSQIIFDGVNSSLALSSAIAKSGENVHDASPQLTKYLAASRHAGSNGSCTLPKSPNRTLTGRDAAGHRAGYTEDFQSWRIVSGDELSSSKKSSTAQQLLHGTRSSSRRNLAAKYNDKAKAGLAGVLSTTKDLPTGRRLLSQQKSEAASRNVQNNSNAQGNTLEHTLQDLSHISPHSSGNSGNSGGSDTTTIHHYMPRWSSSLRNFSYNAEGKSVEPSKNNVVAKSPTPTSRASLSGVPKLIDISDDDQPETKSKPKSKPAATYQGQKVLAIDKVASSSDAVASTSTSESPSPKSRLNNTSSAWQSFVNRAENNKLKVGAKPSLKASKKDESHIVCPWWATYSTCRRPNCPQAHKDLENGIYQRLICPLWKGVWSDYKNVCPHRADKCEFAHVECKHGQWAHCEPFTK